jgi:hypothetical protein
VTFLPSFKDIHPLRLPFIDRLHQSILERSGSNTATLVVAEESLPVVLPVPSLPTPSERLLAVGTQLRHRREERNVSIELLSAHTHIQPHIIEAIESGSIDMLPEFVYVKSSIQRYARAMALDEAAILSELIGWDKPIVESANTYIPTTSRIEIPQQIKPSYIYLAYIIIAMGLLSGISSTLHSNSRSQSQPPQSVIVR